MISNLAIDLETGDLVDFKKNIGEVTGVDAIAQGVASDLRTFLGEYWLDRSIGVPYIDVVFKKGTDLSLINTLLKNHITKRPDVVELTKFEFNVDTSIRKLNILFSAKSVLGDIVDMEVSV